MATFVRIEEGTVVEVVRDRPEDWLEGRFHRDVAARWQRAPDTVDERDVRDGETFRKPPPPPIDEIRALRIREARNEASRRRQGVLESSGAETPADFLSLTARAVAGVRREAKGRPNPGEVARLDQLEALTAQIEAIDNARDTIIAEIRASEDPGSYDVEGSPHWPTPEQPTPEEPTP